MARWPRLRDHALTKVEVRGHVSVPPGGDPLHGVRHESLLIAALTDRGRQSVILSVSAAPEAENARHLSVVLRPWVPPWVARDKADETRLLTTLRELQRHASTDLVWQLECIFEFDETVRSLVALPVPVEEEWAT